MGRGRLGSGGTWGLCGGRARMAAELRAVILGVITAEWVISAVLEVFLY